jgi:hypothetical protein
MRLQDLPPDLHAALSLVLSQRKSYSALAAMLGIEERAVHDRAHAALALLAPRQARELTAAQREQVGEYMLGQANGTQQSATRVYLAGSPPAATWAQALAAELAPLTSGSLPEIPSEAPSDPTWAHEPAPSASQAPSSRRGGAIVLGVLAAIVIVAVALIVGLGGGSHTSSATTSKTPSAQTGSSVSTTTSTTGTSAKAATEPHLDATLTLMPPDPSSKALGIVEVVSQGSRRAFIVAAEHLPPTQGFRYAAWLYNSPSDAFLLGAGPTVGSNGLLKAAGGLPANAAHFTNIILTEEHSGGRPSRPGQIVLGGAFKLS